MILLIIAGAISGIISGMGIGGGIILIPVLTLILGFDQKIAQGITLLYFIPTSIFALIVHIKNKTVDYKVALRVMSTGVIGAGVGAFLMQQISTETLTKIFSVFLLIIGGYQVYSGIKTKD